MRPRLTDDELEAFTDALDDLGVRVSEFLADGTDHTPEEIEAVVDDFPKPDPFDDRPVDE
jgi:hypothetical protein